MPARKDAASQEPGASRRKSTGTSGGSNGRHVAEEALTLSHRFLEIANRHSARVALLEELVAEVQRYTGCAAVGIRMLDEEGNIPYEAYVGFSERFYALESPLSIESDKCMCINVVRGQADPKLPFYTEGGSFFMNGTTRFLATVTEDEKGETRNACNEFGYESVALVPMRLGDRILGVIHVADTREDMVPLAMVEVLEGAAAQLGTAIQRVRAEEALRLAAGRWQSTFDGVADAVCLLDADARIVQCSRAMGEMAGKQPAECVGRNCCELVHGSPHHLEGCPLVTMRSSRRRETLELAVGQRWLQVTVDPLTDEAGNLTGAVHVVRDITERKRAEAEIESLSRFPSENPYPVLRLAADGAVLYANSAGSGLLRARNTQVGGQVPPNWRDCVSTAVDTGSVERREVRHDKKVYVLHFVPIADAGYVDVHGTDITERKHAEEKLRESEQQYRRIVETSLEGIWIIDSDSNTQFVNPRMAEMLGYTVEEMKGAPLSTFMDEEGKAKAARNVERRRQGVRETHEFKFRRKDGSDLYTLVSTNPLFDDDGKYQGALGMVADITDRKRAEDSLAEARQLMAGILEHTHMMAVYLDPQFNFIWVNRAYAATCKHDPSFFPGKNHFDLYPHEENQAIFQRAVDTGEPFFVAAKPFEYPDQPERGVTYWDWSLAPVKDSRGSVTGLVFTLAEVTNRIRAEGALRRSEEMYRDLVEGVDDLVTQVDGEGRFIFVNHTARKVFGLEPRQCVGLSAFDFVHPDDRARTKEAFAGWIRDGRRNGTFENRQIGPGGEVRDMLWTTALHYDDAGEVTAINSIAYDVTDRKLAEARQRKLEERVQHAQKLESLGLLAGGIAHDFNNLLVSVLGNADLALADMSEVAPGRGSVEDIKKAAIRASELTGQMLAYSGRGRFLVGPVDLSELVRETGRLLEVSIPKSASLRYELADGLPAVEADAAQIHQVVMNLITNASEAIGEEGGSITVRTGIIDVGPEYLAATDLGEGLPEGPYVFLEVSDTGRGMDSDTRARLFDPFFSTKFAGRGLGLAAVLGIVRGHKGTIRVYSEPGEGTTFKVLLPFSDRPADKADRPAPAPRDEWRGRGTVLIIDDEPAVRHVARVMLEKTGLTVMAAPDGRTGVELFRQHRDEIDAVLLDLTMPRMSGEETLRQLRRIREDVPVILSSGYDESHATSRFTSDRLAGFLQKPFELKALVGQFRRVMEAKPAGREEA